MTCIKLDCDNGYLDSDANAANGCENVISECQYSECGTESMPDTNGDGASCTANTGRCMCGSGPFTEKDNFVDCFTPLSKCRGTIVSTNERCVAPSVQLDCAAGECNCFCPAGQSVTPNAVIGDGTTCQTNIGNSGRLDGSTCMEKKSFLEYRFAGSLATLQQDCCNAIPSVQLDCAAGECNCFCPAGQSVTTPNAVIGDGTTCQTKIGNSDTGYPGATCTEKKNYAEQSINPSILSGLIGTCCASGQVDPGKFVFPVFSVQFLRGTHGIRVF